MFGSQVTSIQTALEPYFRKINTQQSDRSFRYSLCCPSVAIMDVRRSVLQEEDILCELYADRSSDVTDFCDSES